MTYHKLVIDESSFPYGRKQPDLSQNLEVPRELVLRLEEAVDQLAETGFLTGHGKQAQHAYPRRIREGLKYKMRGYAYEMHSCIITQVNAVSTAEPKSG